MHRNYILALIAFFLSAFAAVAQTGSIQGKVIDKATKEAIPFANVTAYLNGSLVGGGQSDFDGKYSI